MSKSKDKQNDEVKSYYQDDGKDSYSKNLGGSRVEYQPGGPGIGY